MMGETFGDCKPWETNKLQDNTNLLNNLKHNLNSYEKVYKKYSAHTRQELPQIKTQHQSKATLNRKTRPKQPQRSLTKTLDNCKKIKIDPLKNLWNKSVELHSSKSELRVGVTKDMHKRGMTALQTIDKENGWKETLEVGREKQGSKLSYASKIYLMNFEEQNKYRRMKKRELHHLIFGEKKAKCKYLNQIADLR